MKGSTKSGYVLLCQASQLIPIKGAADVSSVPSPLQCAFLALGPSLHISPLHYPDPNGDYRENDTG